MKLFYLLLKNINMFYLRMLLLFVAISTYSCEDKSYYINGNKVVLKECTLGICTLVDDKGNQYIIDEQNFSNLVSDTLILK